MPKSDLYLSDLGGFPRPGEPVLLRSNGQVLLGIEPAELQRWSTGPQAPDAGLVVSGNCENRRGAGGGHVIWINNDSTQNSAYAGLHIGGPAGLHLGAVHATMSTYNQGAIIFTASAFYIYATTNATAGLYLGAAAAAPIVFFTGGTATTNERGRITSAGRHAISGTATPITAPTAYLHIAAGTTTANTAPLKFNSGSLMSSAEAGAVEFLTDKIYFTITTGAARKEFTLNDAALSSGRVPFVTTNGRLTDNTNFTYAVGTLVHSQTTNTPCIMQVIAANNTASYTQYYMGHAAVETGFFSGTGSSWSASGAFLASQANICGSAANGLNVMAIHASGVIRFITAGSATTDEKARIDAAGNVVLSRVALSTSATDGFTYLPSCAGAPSGTPTTYTGMVPMVVDTTNSSIEFYIGGTWKGVTVT